MSKATELCGCETADNNELCSALTKLGHIRSSCGALRLLLPDAEWPKYKKWHSQGDPTAHHQSVVLLALQRGHLRRITSSIHQHVMTSEGPNPNLRQQYLSDLQERWVHQSDPLDRHRKFKMFMGRLVELQVAEWLESQGWVITALEALREGPDIEARLDDGDTVSFEVKFIGADDLDFSGIVRTIAAGPAARSVSPYAAANFLMFRAFEAASQLSRTQTRRIALIVVDDLAWWRFDCLVQNAWIDWSSPRFFEADDTWNAFLASKLKKYPNLRADLGPRLGAVEAVWLLRRGFGSEYRRVQESRLAVPSQPAEPSAAALSTRNP